jgi:hypothetical protein
MQEKKWYSNSPAQGADGCRRVNDVRVVRLPDRSTVPQLQAKIFQTTTRTQKVSRDPLSMTMARRLTVFRNSQKQGLDFLV